MFQGILKDKLVQHTVFYGFLLVLFVFSLTETRGMNSSSRLFPLFVLSVGIVLLFVRLAVNVKELTTGSSNVAADGDGTADDESDVKSMMRNDEEMAGVGYQIRMVVWVIVFGVLMYLFGLIMMVPILMFVFLLIESELPLWKNAAISGLVWGLNYLLFIVVLSVRMHEGVVTLF